MSLAFFPDTEGGHLQKAFWGAIEAQGARPETGIAALASLMINLIAGFTEAEVLDFWVSQIVTKLPSAVAATHENILAQLAAAEALSKAAPQGKA